MNKKINLKIGHKISSNYGEYLYERDKKYQEEKEKKMLLIKQQKYEEEKKNYTFKPNINTEYLKNREYMNNINKINKNIININNNMNRNIYSNLNNYFTTDNTNIINNKNNSFQSKTQKNFAKKYLIKNIKSSKNNYNSDMYNPYNQNNKSNNNKSKIPISTKNKNNINNKVIRNTKLQNNNHLRQFSASKSSNNFNLKNDNQKVFINLFNDLDTDKDNIIIGNNLNVNRVPKNILRIINPIISQLLKDKNRQIRKEDFIFEMNNLFNNMSSIDKRLLIYTYNNRHNKNNSFLSDSNIKKQAFTMRPSTPNYSMKINNYKNQIMNKNNNYDYNNYSNNAIEMNSINKNVDLQNQRIQKNIDEYLYGNNSHYYYGF